MRYALLVLFLTCTAQAQIKPGDRGAQVRLLRLALDVGHPDAAADGPLVAATVKRAQALGHAGNLAKTGQRKVLTTDAGEPAARVAVWLDEADWLAGTTKPQKDAQLAALQDHGALDRVCERAAHDVLGPPPVRPSRFRVLAGAPDPVAELQAWQVAGAALQEAFAVVLQSRLDTGTWPANLPVEQRAVLQARLGEVDVLEVVRHLQGP